MDIILAWITVVCTMVTTALSVYSTNFAPLSSWRSWYHLGVISFKMVYFCFSLFWLQADEAARLPSSHMISAHSFLWMPLIAEIIVGYLIFEQYPFQTGIWWLPILISTALGNADDGMLSVQSLAMVFLILYVVYFHLGERDKEKSFHRLDAERPAGLTNSVPPAHSFGSAEPEPEIDRASVPPAATLPEIRIHIPSAAGVRKTGGCGLRTRDAGQDFVRSGLDSIPENIVEGENVESAKVAFSLQD
jgi:hypothetical protein